MFADSTVSHVCNIPAYFTASDVCSISADYTASPVCSTLAGCNVSPSEVDIHFLTHNMYPEDRWVQFSSSLRSLTLYFKSNGAVLLHKAMQKVTKYTAYRPACRS